MRENNIVLGGDITIQSFQYLIKERILLVCINQSTCSTSTKTQLIDSTLNAWNLDIKRAKKVDYIIGNRHGIGICCFKVEGQGIRRSDGRVFFSIRDINGSYVDLSHLVNGVDLKAAGIRKGYREVQYINC